MWLVDPLPLLLALIEQAAKRERLRRERRADSGQYQGTEVLELTTLEELGSGQVVAKVKPPPWSLQKILLSTDTLIAGF